MRKRALLLLSVLSLSGASCSAGAQKPAISGALESESMRRESFEATLRILDEHPEYVDEFFAAARRHPRTLDRFMKNAASELERDQFARLVAKRLTESPRGLRQVLIATLDEASDEPAALQAISQAMVERPQLAAIVVVQSDASLRRTLRALLLEVLKNPEARRSFLAGLAENSDSLAQVIAPNPDVLRALVAAWVKVKLSKGEKEVAALLKALE
jgi:hypothetical protein